MKHSDIYIIIPAYNEGQRLAGVLDKLSSYDYAVIVVDDGSVDDTRQVADKYQFAEVISHPINCGMGAALQTGNEQALRRGARYIVHFDADGQMSAADISAMTDPLLRGQIDVTIGSRFKGHKINIPWFKRYAILPVARILTWLMTGLWLSDAHNGFRALTAAVAQELNIQQDRMAHHTEITEKIKRYGWRWREVPVNITYHEFGQGVVGGFRILLDVFISKLK
ncbi:MAG: glycosyltransferase family 2 protein [Candidatus Komeilibacteria bacterium]|nr:glycosyltransferase family 2 protein [Candidatus Komeilibacteria bacterium]